MSNVMWFESYWEGMKLEVGGKAASLGEMTGAGLPVPPGFALTTEAFRTCRDAAQLDTSLARLLYGLDVNDMAMVTERCGRIRDVIRTMPMDADVEKSLRHSYAELSRRCGVDDVPVEAGFLNYLTREPVGVVGQVVPWNFPLMFTSWKMGPALAASSSW